METFALPTIPQFPALPDEEEELEEESSEEEEPEEEVPELLPTTTLLGGIEPEAIDDYLFQEDDESDVHFDQRATLAEAIMAAGGVDPSEAVMLGRLLQNKYVYGVIYPEAIETILKEILTRLSVR